MRERRSLSRMETLAASPALLAPLYLDEVFKRSAGKRQENIQTRIICPRARATWSSALHVNEKENSPLNQKEITPSMQLVRVIES